VTAGHSEGDHARSQMCNQDTYTRLVDTGIAPPAPTPPPQTVEITRWGWPRLALTWLGVVTALGLLMFAYHHLAVLAEGGRQPVLKPLVNEMTGAFTGGAMFLPVLWLVRRFPLRRDRWLRSLLTYAAAIVPFGVASTSLMWGLREAVYPLVGLGDFDYGVMPLRYVMELPLQVRSTRLTPFVRPANAPCARPCSRPAWPGPSCTACG